ncbi:MAG: hypothetical protein WDM88_13575 [Galbitalea sp.]
MTVNTDIPAVKDSLAYLFQDPLDGQRGRQQLPARLERGEHRVRIRQGCDVQ